MKEKFLNLIYSYSEEDRYLSKLLLSFESYLRYKLTLDIIYLRRSIEYLESLAGDSNVDNLIIVLKKEL